MSSFRNGFFFEYRRAGLWDVYTRKRDPTSKIGVVVRLKDPCPKSRLWIFIPTKVLRRRFPIRDVFPAVRRDRAVRAYFDQWHS